MRQCMVRKIALTWSNKPVLCKDVLFPLHKSSLQKLQNPVKSLVYSYKALSSEHGSSQKLPSVVQLLVTTLVPLSSVNKHNKSTR